MIGCAPCPKPCKGSIANCITLVRIVIAPTAISPPYFNNEELKQTWMTLSLDCITKVESPRARQGKMTELSKDKFFFLILSFVFLPNKKVKT